MIFILGPGGGVFSERSFFGGSEACIGNLTVNLINVCLNFPRGGGGGSPVPLSGNTHPSHKSEHFKFEFHDSIFDL